MQHRAASRGQHPSSVLSVVQTTTWECGTWLWCGQERASFKGKHGEQESAGGNSSWCRAGAAWSGEEKVWGDALNVQKYLKGKRTRAKFLSVVPSEKSRSNGHEERFGSFPLKSGNSDVREAEHGHRLPT